MSGPLLSRTPVVAGQMRDGGSLPATPPPSSYDQGKGCVPDENLTKFSQPSDPLVAEAVAALLTQQECLKSRARTLQAEIEERMLLINVDNEELAEIRKKVDGYTIAIDALRKIGG